MILEHCHSTSCTQIVESLQRELAQCKAVIKEQKETIDRANAWSEKRFDKINDQSVFKAFDEGYKQ